MNLKKLLLDGNGEEKIISGLYSLMLLCAHLNTIVIFHVDGYDHDYDEGKTVKTN